MSNQRRQKINVLLNNDEKRIVLEKANKYGYGNYLAEYIRDACIHESVYVEAIEDKKEIYRIMDLYIQEIRKCLNVMNSINKNITLTKRDVDLILEQLTIINKSINSLIKTIVEILQVKAIKQTRIRLGFVEKYKTTIDFMDSLLRRKVALIQPSTLNYKSIRSGTILVYLNTCKNCLIDNIDYNAIKMLIDGQRESALKNDSYIFIKIDKNILLTYQALYFDDYNKAIEKQKEDKNNTMIYNFEKEMEG